MKLGWWLEVGGEAYRFGLPDDDSSVVVDVRERLVPILVERVRDAVRGVSWNVVDEELKIAVWRVD